MGHRDRITIPDVLGALAREALSDLDATSSDIRPIVPLPAVPWLVVTYDALREMPLGSREGFVLSLIDGRTTVEMILDLAGFPEDETIAILSRLLRIGAIELHDATPR